MKEQALANTTAMILVPQSEDEIQMMKAGRMEMVLFFFICKNIYS